MVLRLLLIFITTTSVGLSQKNIYKSSKFKTYSRNHKTLAIIPFLGTLELIDENYTNIDNAKKLSKQQGYEVQSALELYFQKRERKKKFKVDFQKTEKTNKIFEANGISYNNLQTHSIKSLSKILGVDGIISGNIQVNTLKILEKESFFSFIERADYGRIVIKISDGRTGKLLWRYDKTITSKANKDIGNLIKSMMKQAARNLPYQNRAQ